VRLSSPGGDLGVSHLDRHPELHSRRRGLVVIPWRGFRCFTQIAAGV